MIADPFWGDYEEQIVALAAQSRLPAVYPSCGDHSASDGREVRLGVPISQLLEIYELLKPLTSAGLSADAKSSPRDRGGAAANGETD